MADATRAPIWQNTEAYEAFMGRWSRPGAEAILAWLGMPPGQRWLDVGCGTGALTQAILDAAEPRAILGVDPSADYLATAAGQMTDPRVRFTVGDARALPVPNDAYDVVIAGLVLNFVSEPEDAVADMVRAAHPGGTVAGYVWDFAGEQQFPGYLWRAATALDPSAVALEQSMQFPLCHPVAVRDLVFHSVDHVREGGPQAAEPLTDRGPTVELTARVVDHRMWREQPIDGAEVVAHHSVKELPRHGLVCLRAHYRAPLTA